MYVIVIVIRLQLTLAAFIEDLAHPERPPGFNSHRGMFLAVLGLQTPPERNTYLAVGAVSFGIIITRKPYNPKLSNSQRSLHTTPKGLPLGF